MTNYKRNKELLDMYGVADIHWGIDRKGKIIECHDGCTTSCIFYGKECCSQARLKWMQEEYKEPGIDWNEIPINTPILVKNFPQAPWTERYFAGYIGGKVCTFDYGYTSEDFNGISHWKYAKLKTTEE